MSDENKAVQPIVVTSTKSVGIAILLTVLFGSLGMFYSTVWGAVIMTILSIIVGVLTLGMGLLITWPVSIIWGAMAASSYNKSLLAQTDQQS
jgi:hypothetical protein